MTNSRGKGIALWVLRVLVGLAFLGAGAAKLTGAPQMVEVFTKLGFGQWFRILTGIIEVAAAIGLFVPRFSYYAAILLAATMAAAVVFHLTVLGGSPAAAAVLLLLSAAIVWLSKDSAWKPA